MRKVTIVILIIIGSLLFSFTINEIGNLGNISLKVIGTLMLLLAVYLLPTKHNNKK